MSPEKAFETGLTIGMWLGAITVWLTLIVCMVWDWCWQRKG